jgi:hypothetical protein
MYEFLSSIAQIFNKVSVHSVRGNHDGTDHYPLMLGLSKMFTDTHVDFSIYSTRTAVFRVDDVVFVVDHGADDELKAKVPKSGTPRESYVQSLLLARPELLVGAKQKIFIQGDMHHYQQEEYNDFEYIMLGALPAGDEYSDHLNLNSRPRQNCLLLSKDGLKAVLHYYFD